MKKIIFATALFGFTFAAIAPDASAQYRGSLQFQEKKKEDKTAKPVPKLFSSKVTSTAEAERLDVINNNLYVSLWNFGRTDLIFQRKLYDLLKFERFKLTRYPAEFKGPTEEALKNLNDNYKKMQQEIDAAQTSYEIIREGIREEDYEILDSLWKDELQKFKEHSEVHFKMQHKFLKTYNVMVKFILKQGGSYYYDASSKGLHFYQNGGLQFFGKTYDKLRKISFEQRKHLRSKPPANIDITLAR